MTLLPADQIKALRELKAFWPTEKLSLIGASALSCLMPEFHRRTYDLDVAVALSINELPSELHKPPGWQRDSNQEHRWLTPDGARVDIIPAGPDLLAAGQLTWPGGQTMNLRGVRHAFSSASAVEIAPELRVHIAAVPVVTLLKIVAYQEQPHRREKDLEDIALALVNYESGNDARRYSGEVLETGLSYEDVCAYLLGRDLRTIVDEDERGSLMVFVELARGRGDGGRTNVLMLQHAPAPGWRGHPEQLQAIIDAFARGLSR